MGKAIFNGFIVIVNESKRKPNSYGLMKEENFLITINGYTVIIFSCSVLIMKTSQ